MFHQDYSLRLRLFIALLISYALFQSKVYATDERELYAGESIRLKTVMRSALTLDDLLSEESFFKPANYPDIVRAAVKASLDLTKQDSLEAVPVYEAAAKYRHVLSLLKLAKYYKREGWLIEATTLNVLAFQL